MKTKSLAEYFEAMTLAVFQSGLSAAVVEAKWEGIVDAFEGFDPCAVADFGPGDVDRLVADASIIRNRRKIDATIHNANRMLDMEADGGFVRWLTSRGDDSATLAAVSREFRQLGPVGTRTFLRMVRSQEVPEVCL